jgi:hypothetical protein
MRRGREIAPARSPRARAVAPSPRRWIRPPCAQSGMAKRSDIALRTCRARSRATRRALEPHCERPPRGTGLDRRPRCAACDCSRGWVRLFAGLVLE